MSKPSHIFIVGLSRTGTSVTRTCLNSSTEVGSAAKSMFFGDMALARTGKAGGIPSTVRAAGRPANGGRGQEHCRLYLWHSTGQFLESDSQASRARRVHAATAGNRPLRAEMLDLAMSYHANGKPIRGEKTPAHIYAVPQLLAWYPNARSFIPFVTRAQCTSRIEKSTRTASCPVEPGGASVRHAVRVLCHSGCNAHLETRHTICITSTRRVIPASTCFPDLRILFLGPRRACRGSAAF